MLTNASQLARGLLTFATLFYGIVPIIADTNATHLLHPAWSEHARLHTAWLISTNGLIAVVALYLMWSGMFERRVGTRLAGLLALCVLGGFFIAAATSGLYGGALADEVGGIAPVFGMDANLLAFSILIILSIASLVINERAAE